MSFIEERPLDAYISRGSSAGAGWQTEIVELSSGFEQRNQAWAYPRHRYVVGISPGKSTKIETLRQLFNSTAGAFSGFRFRDFNDYSSADVLSDDVAFDDQVISVGDGVTLVYQAFKNYTTGGTTVQRKISKLVAGTFVTGFTGASPSPWTLQDSGTRWAVDANTGRITYSADIQKTVTAASSLGGGNTRITATAHGLVVTDTLALSAFTGPWAGMNDLRVAATATTANTIDFAFDSSGYAAYSGNAGQINTIPQAVETVVWGGLFDVPVRFASDEIQIEQIDPGIERASIELIEIKLE